MTYRSPKDLARMMAGTGARAMRGMISARQLVVDTYQAVERVLVRGRQSLDSSADDDGQFDEFAAENCQPIGIVARPEANATIEAVVANVGASGTNPYIIGTIDGTRQVVLDARGITQGNRDLVIVYNSTDVIEVRDGKIRAGSLGGATERLPTWQDFHDLRDFVRNQFDNAAGHVHVVVAGATTLITTSTGPALSVTPADAPSPTGTQVLEAE